MTLLEKINELQLQHQSEFDDGVVPDWFIADKLNEKVVTTQTKYKNILTSTVKGYLISTGEWGAIMDVANNGSDVNLRVLCNNVVESLSGFDFLEVSIDAYRTQYFGLANLLFQSGLITEASKDVLISLAQTYEVNIEGESWAEANNIEVTARSIGIARGANG